MNCSSDKVNYSKIVAKNVQPLTKCGEIHVNDASTDAFLLCSFCTVEPGEDLKFLRTIKEFIAHIVWHRSEDISDDPTTELEIIHLNKLDACADDLQETQQPDPGLVSTELEETNEQFTLSEEVLTKIFDLFKKCPCLWHEQSAAKDQEFIQPAYEMLRKFYNECTKETRSLKFVTDFFKNIKDSFLEQFVGKEATISSDSSSMPPWYFMHLMFLLGFEDEAMDESIYTDFECRICTQAHSSHQNLWQHICECHLELFKDNSSITAEVSDKDETSDLAGDNVKSASSEFLKLFIEAYKNQPRLWSRQHKDYRNRDLRHESLSIILKNLQEHYPETTINDVLAKIKYVRSRFSHERRKIREHKPLDVEYAPRIWYYKKLLFLANDEKGKHKSQTDDKEGVSITNYKCNICGKTFTKSSAWLDHMQCGHEKEAFQSADGYFHCMICNAKCKTKNSFIRHLRQVHTDTNSRICNDCGTKFRFISALAKHRAEVHQDDRPFKCETCGKGYASLFRMNAHSISHWEASDRPYKCEHCGAKFSYRANLNVHVRRHTKKRYIRCDYCDHTSATRSELRFHMLKHTKKYPCFCDICGKGFRSTSLIAMHKNECHGDTMFTCEMCNKQFISEKKLRYHYGTHKPLEKLNCETCGRIFARKGSLQKHIRLKHGKTLKELELIDNALIEEQSSGAKNQPQNEI